MTDKERFISVCRGEKPDYVPIFGFPGAPGMSRGCIATAHRRLVSTGMPASVGGVGSPGDRTSVDSWKKYWGTTDPIDLDFSLYGGIRGFSTESRFEGEYEIITSENGSITRQVVDNDSTYSMPDFIEYPVRDRESWEFYRERMTPQRILSDDEFEAACRRFDERDRPLRISAGGTIGYVRSLMGTTRACTALYDDPELVDDMISWRLAVISESIFPIIERLKPEIITLWEDISGNHAMIVSPDQFRSFGEAYYREVCACGRANSVEMISVDSDGNVMELAPLLASFGVNSMHPFEAKGQNDLFALRKDLPDFILMGWLEKESINEGNDHLIDTEIMRKVPQLLESGRYFPNGDHGIQPLAIFPNLCRFMTLLHELCGNPEGDFPRIAGDIGDPT